MFSTMIEAIGIGQRSRAGDGSGEPKEGDRGSNPFRLKNKFGSIKSDTIFNDYQTTRVIKMDSYQIRWISYTSHALNTELNALLDR